MERIIVLEGQKENLQVSVSYDLGGYSHATGGIKKRGYYLTVSPILVENGFKKFRAFSGVRMLLVEVTRKSNKQYEIACDMVTDELIEKMKEQCSFAD